MPGVHERPATAGSRVPLRHQARFYPLLAKGRHRQLGGSIGARQSSSGRSGRVERWHRCRTSLLTRPLQIPIRLPDRCSQNVARNSEARATSHHGSQHVELGSSRGRVEAVLDLDVGERLIRVDLQEHVTDSQGRALGMGHDNLDLPPRRPLSRNEHQRRRGLKSCPGARRSRPCAQALSDEVGREWHRRRPSLLMAVLTSSNHALGEHVRHSPATARPPWRYPAAHGCQTR